MSPEPLKVPPEIFVAWVEDIAIIETPRNPVVNTSTTYTDEYYRQMYVELSRQCEPCRDCSKRMPHGYTKGDGEGGGYERYGSSHYHLASPAIDVGDGFGGGTHYRTCGDGYSGDGHGNGYYECYGHTNGDGEGNGHVYQHGININYAGLQDLEYYY